MLPLGPMSIPEHIQARHPTLRRPKCHPTRTIPILPTLEVVGPGPDSMVTEAIMGSSYKHVLKLRQLLTFAGHRLMCTPRRRRLTIALLTPHLMWAHQTRTTLINRTVNTATLRRCIKGLQSVGVMQPIARTTTIVLQSVGTLDLHHSNQDTSRRKQHEAEAVTSATCPGRLQRETVEASSRSPNRVPVQLPRCRTWIPETTRMTTLSGLPKH